MQISLRFFDLGLAEVPENVWQGWHFQIPSGRAGLLSCLLWVSGFGPTTLGYSVPHLSQKSRNDWNEEADGVSSCICLQIEEQRQTLCMRSVNKSKQGLFLKLEIIIWVHFTFAGRVLRMLKKCITFSVFIFLLDDNLFPG